MTAEDTNLRTELEERLRFETLIADLSSKFVNLPHDKVDGEIMDAERRICELLHLDFSTLWQWSDQAPGFFTLTHFHSAQEGPQPPERMNQDQYPWARQQLLAGRIMKIASLADMPAEAARDRESLRQFGIKSNLALPLSVGGEQPIGLLGLGTTQAERDWPDTLVKRLRLLAQIFANALTRKRADQALRESEERMTLAILDGTCASRRPPISVARAAEAARGEARPDLGRVSLPASGPRAKVDPPPCPNSPRGRSARGGKDSNR